MTKTATKTKGTGGPGVKCKSKSHFGDACSHNGDHTQRHSWDTGEYRRRKAAGDKPAALAVSPAIYDPVGDPVGAKKADDYLAKKAAETPPPAVVTDVPKVEVTPTPPEAPKPVVAAPEVIDVLISFDTTGSMQPCIAQVRREVDTLVQRLFKEIPQIRVGIIGHGDYCDGPRAITKLPITDNQKEICNFIRTVPNTGGGDLPECYELVLHESRSYNWKGGAQKVLVMIGDDVPHPAHYYGNTKKIDWRSELKALLAAGVHVYGVQALGNSHARHFYEEIARTTGGFHLELDQFSQIGDLIMAICFKQQGNEALQAFERSVECNGRMTRSMDKVFSTLLGREVSAEYTKSRGDGLVPVPPSRFQVLNVDKEVDIKTFCEENSVAFQTGRGFYEFTKTVEVQDHKEVILQEKKTGDMFSGREARQILGLSDHGTQTINPRDIPVLRDGVYVAFIQSTSSNRKLLPGTRFLYEVSRH